jgi:parallel beta-helix repeat protein
MKVWCAVLILVLSFAVLLGLSCGKGGTTPTTPTTDTTPPIITNFSAIDITGASATFTWTTDEPATSEVSFGGIYPLGAMTGFAPPDKHLVTQHSFKLTRLSPNSNYRVTVGSSDKAGNTQSQGYILDTHLEISQVISGDTTWTKENSPYVITGNILVPSGVTLTIEPGVTVKFGWGMGMQIDGELVARGTEAEPIVFASNQTFAGPVEWGDILFTDSSVGATFDQAGNYLSGSIMQYCTVEYAGVKTICQDQEAIKILSSSPFIDHCTITGNGGGGIYILRGSARVTNNVISNNSAANWGAGICCWYNDGDVTISGNTITNNSVGSGGGVGIYCDCYNGNLSISGNDISHNSGELDGLNGSGIACSCEGGVVSISGNTISNNSGGGISCSCHSGTVNVSGNTINDNSAYAGGGVYCWVEQGTMSVNNNDIRSNSGDGVYIFSGNPVINHNNLVGNTPYEIYENAFSSHPPVDATDNWWGTTDEGEIHTKIGYRLDGANFGTVNCVPYLTEPVAIT